MWAQGRAAMPPIVEACVKSIERNAGGRKVNVIDMKNVRDYVNIPQTIYDKVAQGKITFTHFSDIVRTALLSQYGGFWIDATIYVTSSLPNYELPFYSIRQHCGNERFVECRDGSNWSAYFIACGKGNAFVKTIYDFFIYYWEHYDHMIDYFLIDYSIAMLYRNSDEFREIIDRMPFDNETVNDMRLNINKPYNEELWRSLAKTRYNKLSWKMSLADGDTIGGHILAPGR